MMVSRKRHPHPQQRQSQPQRPSCLLSGHCWPPPSHPPSPFLPDPTPVATMRTGHNMVYAAVAAAAVATAAAMSAGVVAGVGKACHHVPIHRVLAAPGGVYNLDDGRQLRARRVDVGGCTTMSALATGVAYPDAGSNYTVMSHQSNQCVTGTERDTEQPTYKGFQAVVVEANGFKFTADLVLEDIDAQVVQDPTTGWRETMSSLGVADNQLVAPSFRVTPDALVGISKFRMPAKSLKEVGFPAGNDLLIDGAAYSSWVHTKSTLAALTRELE